MILIHITEKRSREQKRARWPLVGLMTVFTTMSAEALVVDWPCTRPTEPEPAARVSRCTMGLTSMWTEYEPMEDPSPEGARISGPKPPGFFQQLHRGVVLIRLVVCGTTELVRDFLENTFEARKEH